MKKPFRIAIAGLGTVGSATLTILERNQQLITTRAGQDIQVVAVSAREKRKHAEKIQNGIRWFDNAQEMALLLEVDAVAVLVGGENGIALEIAEIALKAGKSVVTANKALLAAHGIRLAKLAEENGAKLMLEASVAGGMPVIKTLREATAANKITAIQGILNGTCNYILTRMADAGLDFDMALKEAQEKGYAEADPAMDIDGHDTAHKLSLLAALGFGTQPSLKECPVIGIRNLHPIDMQFACELGYRIKLLGVAHLTENGLEKRVGPCLVPERSTLANTNDVLNAVSIQGDALGILTLTGRGAGGEPTASAVIADLVDLARGTTVSAFGVPADNLKEISSTPAEKRFSGWYLRTQVLDKPGVLAALATILRDEAISIESALQRGRSRSDNVPVIIKTHVTNEASMLRALAKMAALESVQEQPCAMRIEE